MKTGPRQDPAAATGRVPLAITDLRASAHDRPAALSAAWDLRSIYMGAVRSDHPFDLIVKRSVVKASS